MWKAVCTNNVKTYFEYYVLMIIPIVSSSCIMVLKNFHGTIIVGFNITVSRYYHNIAQPYYKCMYVQAYMIFCVMCYTITFKATVH